jgi:hypothetical protein
MINQSTFSITIGVAPNASLTIDREITFIKTALLYADTVKLCSPKTSLCLPLLNSSMLEKIEFLKNNFSTIMGSDASPDGIAILDLAIEMLRSNKHSQSKIDIEFAQHISQLTSSMEQILKQAFSGFYANMNELSPAVKKSILTFDVYNGIDDIITLKSTPKDKKQFILNYLHHIESMLKNGNYLMLDDYLGNYFSPNNNVQISPAEEKRLKHIEVMHHLMEELPTLTNVSIKEILDIRQDLSQYLKPFRSAILNYAKNINSAPWSEDFQYECEEIFIKEIDPAINEMHNQWTTNKNYTNHFLNIMSTLDKKDFGLLLTPWLMSIVNYSNLLVSTLGAATVLAPKFAKELSQMRTFENTIKQNPLFFYYKVNESINQQVKK